MYQAQLSCHEACIAFFKYENSCILCVLALVKIVTSTNTLGTRCHARPSSYHVNRA